MAITSPRRWRTPRGDYLIVVNDAGDLPLRFDGTTWTTLSPDEITRQPRRRIPAITSSRPEPGHVCKYRNRWFFIERNSMNAWYLGINAIGGALNMIPLSGAATKGGKLLFCAVWSLDAGDGIDDKMVFWHRSWRDDHLYRSAILLVPPTGGRRAAMT